MADWNDQTRLINDPCAKLIREESSKRPGGYKIQTPGFRPCVTQAQYAQYMTEPAHYQKVYKDKCGVKTESGLQLSTLTDKRYIHQLYTRPYSGAFMGAGQPNANQKDVESALIHGHDTRGLVKRACDVLSGVTIDRFNCLPEYGNPQRVQHIVPVWTRGGDNTRDFVRRVNYEKRLRSKRAQQAANKGDRRGPPRPPGV